MSPLLRAWLAVWHIPGNAWKAALKAAPIPIWMRFGGAMVVTGLLLLTIWINWKGPWPVESWKVRLDWNGMLAVLLVLALIICVVALFDFRVKLSASPRDGVHLAADGDHDDRRPPERPQ